MWFEFKLINNISELKEEKMSFELFNNIYKSIINNSDWQNEPLQAYFTNENSLTHTKIDYYIENLLASFNGINILTNGKLLKEKINLIKKFKNKINIEILFNRNASDIQDYLEELIKNIEFLKKNQILFWMRYDVTKNNKNLYKIFIELSAKYDIQFNNIIPSSDAFDDMLEYEEWQIFKEEFKKYEEKLNFKNSYSLQSCGFETLDCNAFIKGITINTDGTICGCGKLKDIVGTYQNIAKFVNNDYLKINETCMKPKWSILNNNQTHLSNIASNNKYTGRNNFLPKIEKCSLCERKIDCIKIITEVNLEYYPLC